MSDDALGEIHAQVLREKPEPAEGSSPAPIALIFLVSVLAFVGGIYLVRFAGEFDALAFDPAPRGAAGALAAKPVDPMVLGARLFNQNCVTCHQAGGQGVPGSFPPLAGSEWVAGSEERLVRILLLGMSGPVEVHGATYNGIMPAFGPASGYRFDERKIAAVLTYVRASFGNSAPAVTPEKVKEIMAAVGSRTAPWTAAELEPLQ
jgi:mono/diheme cytochrome c family protein